MLSERTQVSSLALPRVLRQVQLDGLILLQGKDSVLVKGKFGFYFFRHWVSEVSCGKIIA